MADRSRCERRSNALPRRRQPPPSALYPPRVCRLEPPTLAEQPEPPPSSSCLEGNLSRGVSPQLLRQLREPVVLDGPDGSEVAEGGWNGGARLLVVQTTTACERCLHA